MANDFRFITLRVPPELHVAVARTAAQLTYIKGKRTSINSLVTRYVVEGLKNDNPDYDTAMAEVMRSLEELISRE